MGQVIGDMLKAVGLDLGLAGFGLVMVGVVVLGIMNAFSIFDETMTHRVKSGVIKLMWSAAGIGGAGLITTFITEKAHIAAG